MAFHDNDQFTGMDMREPTINFAGLASSLGMWSARVERIEDLPQALLAARESGGPGLVEVMVEDGFA